MTADKKHIKPKFSRLLLTSIIFTAIGLLSLCAVVYSWVTGIGFLSYLVYCIVVFPALVICCLAVLFGIVDIVICVIKKEKLNRSSWASFSSIFLALMTILIICLFLTQFRYMYYKDRCLNNLRNMIEPMGKYSRDKGKYPDADKWCDLLLEHAKYDLNYGKYFDWALICPGAGDGRCHYAINPNVTTADRSSDTVLLFECKAGWNQFGGPEILTLENHDGKGCNILFADRHIEWVSAEKIKDLKWIPDTKRRKP